jgi:HEAT repeat protein
LKNDDEERVRVREEAAKALGRLGDKKAVELLIQALMNKDSRYRIRAAEVLDKMGWNAENDTEKAYYLIAKGKWDDLEALGKPAVEPLIIVLKDESRDVRAGAAEALGKIGDKRAIEPLIQTLKNENSIGDLEKLEDPDRLPFMQALKETNKNEYDHYYDRAGAVAEALGKIGFPAVVPLIQALNDENGYVRAGAAEALGKIGDKRAIEPLIQALRDDNLLRSVRSGVRARAAEALGRIGDKRAVEPLIQVSKNDDEEHVKWEASKALYRIQHKVESDM